MSDECQQPTTPETDPLHIMFDGVLVSLYNSRMKDGKGYGPPDHLDQSEIATVMYCIAIGNGSRWEVSVFIQHMRPGGCNNLINHIEARETTYHQLPFAIYNTFKDAIKEMEAHYDSYETHEDLKDELDEDEDEPDNPVIH